MCATIMALGHAQLGSDLDKHVVKCAHTSSARIALTPITVSGRRLVVFANHAVAPPTQPAFREYSFAVSHPTDHVQSVYRENHTVRFYRQMNYK